MPIKIPDSLPAKSILESEHIFVMTEHRALHQDIRPLKILLLNLMPTKMATETQFLRCFSNTPLQVEVDLLQTSSHVSKNTSQDHLLKFYKTFDEVCQNRYDGMIITGAPVEHLKYEDVDYWPEVCRIMDWSKTNVQSSFYVCWGAQAGLYYHYGIDKVRVPKKIFGVYRHKLITPKARLFRGFDDTYLAPQSRHTIIRKEDILANPNLRLMSYSEQAGVTIVGDIDGRQFFVLSHSEYDSDTLKKEYLRDKEKGLDIDIPCHYFPNDDPSQEPENTWRAHGNLMYTNWLNYYVYQTTPYDINEAFDNTSVD